MKSVIERGRGIRTGVQLLKKKKKIWQDAIICLDDEQFACSLPTSSLFGRK